MRCGEAWPASGTEARLGTGDEAWRIGAGIAHGAVVTKLGGGATSFRATRQ
jgi:hypothetical protein